MAAVDMNEYVGRLRAEKYAAMRRANELEDILRAWLAYWEDDNQAPLEATRKALDG